MRVLHLCTWYPYPEKPGLGIFIQEHAQASVLAGAHAEVIALLLVPDASVWGWKRELSTQTLPSGLVEHRLVIRSRWAKALYHVPALLRRWLGQALPKVYPSPPDLIHAHVSYPAGYLAMGLAKKWNTPYLITDHWSGLGRYLQKGPWKAGVHQAISQAGAFTVVSRFLAQELEPLVGRPIQVLPNVVDDQLFVPAPKATHPEPHILSVMNLVAPKRPDLILEALGRYTQEQGPLTWTIAGQGPLRPVLEKAAEAFPRLTLRFAGQVVKSQLASLYQQADLLIHASERETFGLVTTEALFCGTPILASRVGGLVDQVQEGINGYLFDNEPDTLYTVLHKALSQSWDPTTLRQTVGPQFGREAVARQLGELYRALLSSKN